MKGTTTFRDDHPGDSAVFDVTPSVFEVDTPNTTFGTSLDAESSPNDSVASDRLSDIGEDDSIVVDPDNAHHILREIRVKNVGRIVIGTLNINSIASKFEKLKVIISNSLDILVIQETKLDSSFPDSQLLMDGYRKPYRLDRNYTKRLLKREKKKYFHNLDTKNYTDNKKFWKTVKPLFSNSTGGSQKITLVNGKEIISNDEEIAKTFHDFFIDSVKSMNINGNNDVLTDVEGLTDPVDIALKKFECHPSILDIKENISIETTFSFSEVRYEDVMLEVNNLDVKKAGTNIPTELLKQMKEVIVEPLMHIGMMK